MKKQPALQGGLQIVAIIHIDTAGSRKLYKNISPHEKARCAKLLKEFFEGIVKKNRGTLSKWEGDGGFALFPFTTAEQIMAVFNVGKTIIEELPHLNAQTAKILNWDSFHRHVRLKAHKGEVVLTEHRGLDSADPQHFDDFLKHEKKFAPKDNAFFATSELYHHFNETEKNKFKLFKKKINAGSLRVDLYRLCRVPSPKAEDILRRGDEVSEITQSDWLYLRDQITQHFKNVAARNQITKNLIMHLSTKSGKRPRLISPEILLESTLDALYSYTHVIFPDCRIRVSYWRAVQKNKKTVLKMVSFRYPDHEKTNPSKRIVQINDERFKVCECFRKKEPVVTPCVTEARLQNTWHDFDLQQKDEQRALDSALQIPVYCELSDLSKEMKGVVSLDADKPDMFLPDEVPLWRDALVGFLVNLSLAEKMREGQA
jgi:hypothetical protein